MTFAVRFCLVLGSALLLCSLARADTNAQTTPTTPKTLSPFSLSGFKDLKATKVEFSSDPTVRFRVVCFLGTECPLARIYGPRLQAMSEAYSDRGIEFIGVNSNVQDSLEEVEAYVKDLDLRFPMGKDFDRAVALNAGATRTPEVFVIDRAGAVRYQGRIDDQYQPGISRSEAKQHDLEDALDQLVAGEAVATPKTEAVGCLISLPRQAITSTDVTFCRDVMPVLQKHCTECHRDGEIGPFAMEEFDEIVGWADMCVEVVDQGRMPPWHANPDVGEFANARHMPERDKELLRKWVDAGMPYGDPEDLPPKPTFTQGWRFEREPDLVLPMSDTPFEVPADGTVEYQYYVVDPGFTEDRWVRAAQVIPGDSGVVHHCICFTRPPDDANFRDIGLLSAYVPGQIRGKLPTGYAQRVRAGSRIVFQMHYTPNGKRTSDITQLGLVFADAQTVTHEIIALGGAEQEFEIPPQAAAHAVRGDIGWHPAEAMLLSIMPHMHLRGKSFQFQLEQEGGDETILDVPLYDFNWQHNYELAEPIPLANVNRLRFTATFDNSADNPTNPDPQEFVTWGDQTWQEMAVTFVTVARPLDAKPVVRTSGSKSAAELETELRAKIAERENEARKFAKDYIARFDRSGDGKISEYEFPESVRIYSFRRFDHNRDGRVSEDEIADEAMRRLRRKR